MIALTNAICLLYKKCVRCYPTSFRLEFEEEMYDVFTKAVADANASGFMSIMALFFREIRDYP
ncbi:MAG: hypothetical protein A2Z14_18950 [Chloroflexi bacterium RBG_16_48_8]|nr:MAG: hypothetical protein A2Z14_18950 [Chloroflexi bacterium RBG_16_48_8]